MPLCNFQAVPGVGQASKQGHSPPVPAGRSVRPGLSCVVSGRKRWWWRPACSSLSSRFTPLYSDISEQDDLWDLFFYKYLHVLRVWRWSRTSENGNGSQEDGLRYAECVESVWHKLQLQVCHRCFTVNSMLPLFWEISVLYEVLVAKHGAIVKESWWVNVEWQSFREPFQCCDRKEGWNQAGLET